MAENHRFKKIFASVLISILLIFIIYALSEYITAFFGAIILYSLFNPMYQKFLKKFRLKKSIAAISIILISIVIIIVPLIILLSIISEEVTNLISEKDSINMLIEYIDTAVPEINFQSLLVDRISEIVNFLKYLAISALQKGSKLAITMTIMFFCLYYLLINDRFLKGLAKSISPFNRENTDRLIKEFRNITYSGIVSTGIIAVAQGALITIGCLIFQIKGAILLGFITGILSFLPIVGPTLIWIPIVIIKLLQDDYLTGILFFVLGLIVSNVDNIFRPFLQRKIGNIHPLISLIGVFIGISYFGLLGIIIGPILLSYLLLTVRMFKDEYLSSSD